MEYNLTDKEFGLVIDIIRQNRTYLRNNIDKTKLPEPELKFLENMISQLDSILNKLTTKVSSKQD